MLRRHWRLLGQSRFCLPITEGSEKWIIQRTHHSACFIDEILPIPQSMSPEWLERMLGHKPVPKLVQSPLPVHKYEVQYTSKKIRHQSIIKTDDYCIYYNNVPVLHYYIRLQQRCLLLRPMPERNLMLHLLQEEDLLRLLLPVYKWIDRSSVLDSLWKRINLHFIYYSTSPGLDGV